MRPALGLALLLAVAGCGDDLMAGAHPDASGDESDPLAFDDTPEAGSFDEIHRRVLVRSCAGEPGLCHAGQFEPNLSTPALAYANLVNRPGLERPDELRVAPGSAAASLLVAKLEGGPSVATQMPLGADPLDAEELALVRAWIESGAPRRPGEGTAPLLNHRPAVPEIAVYDDQGERLDEDGPFTVAAGTTLVLWQSVTDFETPDAMIPAAIFLLQLADGRSVVLTPGGNDPGNGLATYDSDGPWGVTDQLTHRFSVTLTDPLPIIDGAGVITNEPVAGMQLSVIALYVDALPITENYVVFAIGGGLIEVE